MDYANHFLFGIYPYIALAVFLVGSLIRFDREQYTWKSDSSQLLRRGQLRFGSNLFHVGILPRLVKTRHGFHIVCIDRRMAGTRLPFEAVRECIAEYLAERVRRKATQQYLRYLVRSAKIEGVDLDGAPSPLLR